jgi:hypothetical protein
VWTEVTIPLTKFGSPSKIARINWQNDSGDAQKVYYLDDIQLIGTQTNPPPTGNGLTLSVDVNTSRKPISPDIYGMNEYETPGNVATFLKELRLPVRRWGGNITTRYNWKNDIGNHASDWYFNNLQESNSTNPPDDSAVNRFINLNRAAKADSLVVLPLIGYVSNDNAEACGFSVKKYGAQTDTAAGDDRPDCGNGILKSTGKPITGNDPLDTSIKIDQNFIADWVKYLVGRYGSAQNGGVRFYNLDNEPDIWFETHREVWPIGYNYDQFRDLTYLYGAAIKAADPSAQLLGPVVNGWTYYFHSSYDGQREDWETPDDRNAHGGTDFIPWYLQQMQDYEQQNGVRILDYLDVHYYPASDGVSLSPAGSAATQALRLRSTRSLWDPTYVDESWIKDAGPDNGIIQLIPRLKQWIADNYPGTKTAITEYNWGGLKSINGAVTEADVLGIFGREGLDLATLWQPPALDDPGAFAFRIYRNYNDNGGEFGDTSVSATSSDQGKVSVYAAQRSSDNALTIMIVNKTTTAQSAPLTIANFSGSTAQLYRYSSANLKAIVREADVAVTNGKLTATYPASSITLLVLPPKTSQEPTPTPTPTQMPKPGETPHPNLDNSLQLPFVKH